MRRQLAAHGRIAIWILCSTAQSSTQETAFASSFVCSMSMLAAKWSGLVVSIASSHDALTLQGEIAAETAAQIDPELLLREGERLIAHQSTEPTAYSLVLRAIPAIYRLEPSGFHAAGDMLAAAVAVEPGNAAAHAWWAYWHLLLVGQGWAKDPIAATGRAGELAERAVTFDPADARALTLVGHVRSFLHKRPEEARALHERALSVNPHLPLAWCFSGFAHSYLGRQETAIQHITQAQRLSPHDPHAFFFDMALMMPHFLRGDFENAIISGRRAIELNPGCSSTYKGYLATLGHLQHDQEAARVPGSIADTRTRLLHQECHRTLADDPPRRSGALCGRLAPGRVARRLGSNQLPLI